MLLLDEQNENVTNSSLYCFICLIFIVGISGSLFCEESNKNINIQINK